MKAPHNEFEQVKSIIAAVEREDIRLHEADNHHTDFLNAVRTRGRPGTDIAIGARSITVCHLGNIAYELKRPLKWDPVKEEFPDDDEANRMTWRPMREPWRI